MNSTKTGLLSLQESCACQALQHKNLDCHLKDHHPEIYAEFSRGKSVKRKQQTLTEVIEKAKIALTQARLY